MRIRFNAAWFRAILAWGSYRLRALRKGLKRVARGHARGLESLEHRLIMAAELGYGSQAGDEPLTLTFHNASAEYRLIDASGRVIASASAASAAGRLTIVGTDADDALRLDIETLPEVTIDFAGAGNDSLAVTANVDFSFGDTELIVGTHTVGIGGFELVLLIGGVGDNRFELADQSIVTTVQIDGLGGTDTLIGGDISNAWQITGSGAGAGSGEVNDVIRFVSIENLTGGTGNDAFTFSDMAGIVGMIDGGSGNNSLNYDAYTTPISIDLTLQTATGTGGARSFRGVTGGQGIDTLTGQSVDGVWRIAGVNEGTIEFEFESETIDFSAIENLTGIDAVNDDFVVESGGSITGTIRGGSGSGIDGLVIAQDGVESAYAIVNVPSATALTVARFGKSIAVDGIEPIVGGTAAARVISGSSLEDEYEIESVNSDTLRISSTETQFYDLATDGLVSSFDFTKPSTSLKFFLRAENDRLFVGTLQGMSAVSIEFDGGQGSEYLLSLQTANEWLITGADRGTLNAGLDFVNVENLRGGSRSDRFVFLDQATISGMIDGGGDGVDTLDYSAYSTDLDIPLGVGNLNIDQVIGGSGRDTLFGYFGDNVWQIDGVNAGTVDSVATTTVRLNADTIVDPVTDTLRFRVAHELSTGETVTYATTLMSDTSGLTSRDYFVLAVDEESFRLTLTKPEIAEISQAEWTAGARSLTRTSDAYLLTFDGKERIDGLEYRITGDRNHGLSDGDQVTYQFQCSTSGCSDNSLLVAGQTYFVLVVDAKTIQLLEGAPTVVPLGSSTSWSSGATTLTSRFEFGEVGFAGIENLTGGDASDRFLIGQAGDITGQFDGLAGENTLDYTAKGAAITIRLDDLSVSATGPDGVRNIDSVIAGGAGSRLIGPVARATWEVTGIDAGHVEWGLGNRVDFTGFANLEGASGTQDGLIVRAGGQLTGSFDGGAEGRDGLVIENPAQPGELAIVIPTAGSGAIAAGQVYAGVAGISFVGIERPFVMDASVPGELGIHGSAIADRLELSQTESTLVINLRTASHLLWDQSVPAFVSKTRTFTIEPQYASRIVQIGLDEADQMTIANFTPGVATPLESEGGGEYRFSGDVFTRGAPITISADSIVVDPGVTLSTRVTDPFARSIGDSGHIALTAAKITIESGAELLTFDDRLGTTDPAGIPAGLSDIEYPRVEYFSGAQVSIWQPGYMFRNVATDTDGAGSGMTIDLVVGKDGVVTTLLHTSGSGYAQGDKVWATLGGLGADQMFVSSYQLAGNQLFDIAFDMNLIVVGGSGAKVVTFDVGRLLDKGGDIALTAKKYELVAGAFGMVTTEAKIEIGDAYLQGRNVNIRADANNHESVLLNDWLGDVATTDEEALTVLEELKLGVADFVKSMVELLIKYRPFVGIGMLDAEAKVSINPGAEIIADGNVKISAAADSMVALDVLSDLLGGGYARSVANAKVEIGTGVIIRAGEGIDVSAWTINSIVVSLQVGGDLASGMIRGLSGTPFGIGVLISDCDSDAWVSIAQGSLLHALNGDVNVLAVTTRNVQPSGATGGEYKVLSISFVWSTGDALARTEIDGQIISDNGDVRNQSMVSSLANQVNSTAAIGTGTFQRLVRQSMLINAIKSFGGGKAAKAQGAVSQLFSGLGLTSLGSMLSTDDGSSAEKFKTFGGSFSFGYTQQSASSRSSVGSDAIITAGRSVYVLSDAIDRPTTIAAASVALGQASTKMEDDPGKVDKNGIHKQRLKETKKKYAGAVAIVYGSFTNEAFAQVLPGAVIDANRAQGLSPSELVIQARTLSPYEFPLERFLGLADFFGKLAGVLAATNRGATTSLASAKATAEKTALAGSFNVLKLRSSANANIGSGARLNQHPASGLVDVEVRATTDNQIVNFAADPIGLTQLFGKVGSSGGGGFSAVYHVNQTRATIDEGAIVKSHDLMVEADTRTTNVSFGIAGSAASGISVNGVIIYVDIDNNTLALISNGATVDAAGSIRVSAEDDLMNASGAGGISLGKSLGVGISGAGNRISRNTRAIIGFETEFIATGVATLGTGVDSVSDQIDLGYPHGFVTGDTVRYVNAGLRQGIRGLVDGGLYHVRVISPNVVALARSLAEANGSAPGFASAAIDDASDHIQLGYEHGFETGDAVVYDHGTGSDVAGLVHGQAYYVIPVDATTVQLATSQTDAEESRAIDLNRSTQPGSGSMHRLRLDIDATGVRGDEHQIGRVFDPQVAVVGLGESIDLGQPHGFQPGQAIVYRKGSGAPIGGLVEGQTYYAVIEPASPNLLRLANSQEDAVRTDPVVVGLSGSGVTGTGHGFGVAFDPSDTVVDSGDTIDLGYPHRLRGGDLVVYDNGGGTNIGGLTQGATYSVMPVGDTAIKLRPIPAVAALADDAWGQGTRTLTSDTAIVFRLDGNASVDGASETITFGETHGLIDGEPLRYAYDGVDGDNSGLADGQSYRVLVVDFRKIKLVTAPLSVVAINAEGTTGVGHTLRLPFSPAERVTDAPVGLNDTIDLGYVHGLTAGQRVIYTNGGGEIVRGLANRNEYFVIRVSDREIRLAATEGDARAGLAIDLDISETDGSSHSIGAAFRAIPLVDSRADTIRFDSAHSFQNGQAVVYDNGDGTSIGGLTDSMTYYVLVVDTHTIRLSDDAANLAGSVVNLDAALATGIGHRLSDATGVGSLRSVGEVVVDANNTGRIGTGTLSASKTSTATKKDSDEAAQSPDGSKWGLAISGSVSVNLIDDRTEAVLREAVITQAGDVRIEATNSTTNTAIAGAFALSFNKSSATSVGLAGAVTVNTIDSKTHAFIESSVLTAVGTVTVNADALEKTLAIAAGLGSASNGYGIAGSVAVNTINSDTQSRVIGGAITGQGLHITASDQATIIAVAGAIAYGGKAGVGAGAAYNSIRGGAQAALSRVDVDVIDALVVNATNRSKIDGVAAAIGVAYSSPTDDTDEQPGLGDAASEPPQAKSFGLAVALGLSINKVHSVTTATISESGTTADPLRAGSVSVTASDTESRINGVGGGIAIGLAKLGNATAGATAMAVGGSFVYNVIDSTLEAVLEDSVADVRGDFAIVANASPEIFALAIAGAFAGATGTASSNAYSGAGSVTVNTVKSKTWARLRRGNVRTSQGGNVTVNATDDSSILADAGGVAISVAIGEGASSDALAVAVGAAVAINRIVASRVEATVDQATILASGNLAVTTHSTTEIDSLALGGAVAIGASGGGGGIAFSGAGAVTYNTVRRVEQASLSDSSATAPRVDVTTSNESKIIAETVGFSVAVGASSGNGGGGSLSVGASLADNVIDIEQIALVDSSQVVSTVDGITISSTDGLTIRATGVAASLAASYSSTSDALAVSGGGVGSKNRIGGKTNAYADASVLTSAGQVVVSAIDTLSKIDSEVVAAAVSVAIAPSKRTGAVAIGASRSRNVIADENELPAEVRAYLNDTDVTATGALKINAIANREIDSSVDAASVAISAGNNAIGAAGAGVDTRNSIKLIVEASADGGDTGPATTIRTSAVEVTASDSSLITATAGSLAVAAAFSSKSGGAISVGVSLARNRIDNVIDASVSGIDGLTTRGGDIVVSANNLADVTTTATAVSVSGSLASTGTSASFVGGGTDASNIILTKTNAAVRETALGTATERVGKVDLDAKGTSRIKATVGAVAAAGAVSGETSVGFAIGVAIARNFIGWDPHGAEVAADHSSGELLTVLASGTTVRVQSGPMEGEVFRYIGKTLNDGDAATDGVQAIDLSAQNYYDGSLWRHLSLTPSAGDVQARLIDTSVQASGAITIDAFSDPSIDAVVFAGAGAMAFANKTAIALSGAGVNASNRINERVTASIEGDGQDDATDGIRAANVSLRSSDAANINAVAAAASLAFSFGGQSGVSVAVGVSLAFNEITRDVSAFIAGANEGIQTSGGDISINAASLGQHLFELTSGGIITAGSLDDAAESLPGEDQDLRDDQAVLAGLRTAFADAGLTLPDDRLASVVATYFSDEARNVSLAEGDTVRVANGHSAGGTIGRVYRYIGSDRESVNLAAENYAHGSNWLPLETLRLAVVEAGRRWSLVGPDGRAYLIEKDGSKLAIGQNTINAVSAAASLAFAASGASGAAAISGAGAVSQNVILSQVNAYVDASRLGTPLQTVGTVAIAAHAGSAIGAFVLAAVGSGANGLGVAIGAAMARNDIGWEPNEESRTRPAEVQAYLKDTSVHASGAVTLDAVNESMIDAVVIAGSMAISAGGPSGGLAAGGSGVNAHNKIGVEVRAFIDGDGSGTDAGIHAAGITLRADDASEITSSAWGVSVGFAFAGLGAVALTIGVSLANNRIDNDIAAFIHDAEIVTAGAIMASADDDAFVKTTSIAIAVSFSMGTGGWAISGGGAESTNVVLTKNNAYLSNSQVGNASAKVASVDILTSSATRIDAMVGTIAASAALGGGGGALGVAIGAAIARNYIGWDPKGETVTAHYESHDQLSTLATGARVRVTDGPMAGEIFQYLGPTLTDGDRTASGNQPIDLTLESFYDASRWLPIRLGGVAAEVRSRSIDTAIWSSGPLNLEAVNDQAIDAVVFAGSFAMSIGTGSAAFSGAGVSTTNMIRTNVMTAISGDGVDSSRDGIHASTITMNSQDSSTVGSIVAAASVAAAFGSGLGLSFSIGVAHAYNEIANDVTAFVRNADEGIFTAADGRLAIQATSRGEQSGELPIGGQITIANLNDASNAAQGAGADADAASDAIVLDAIRIAFANMGEPLASDTERSKLQLSASSEGERWSVIAPDGQSYLLEMAADRNSIVVFRNSINAVAAAASLAATVSTAPNAAFSGAGAAARNVVLTQVTAYVDSSRIGSATQGVGDIDIDANSNTGIGSFVLTASLALAVGSPSGLGVSIGASIAENLIGWKVGETVPSRPAMVKANLNDTSVRSFGTITIDAVGAPSIDALVVSGSAAIASGASGAGAGARTVNRVGVIIDAAIEGSGSEGIRAFEVSLNAKDVSNVTAWTGAASLAASLAGASAVSLAIGVGTALNEIGNIVTSGIREAAEVTTEVDRDTDTVGPVTLYRGERVRVVDGYLTHDFATNDRAKTLVSGNKVRVLADYMEADLDTSFGKEEIHGGTNVRVLAGHARGGSPGVYRFKGVTVNGIEIDLSIEDFANTSRWIRLQGIVEGVYLFVGTAGSIDLSVQDYANTASWIRLGGEAGSVYEFVGSTGALDLGREDYTNTARWARSSVQGISIDAEESAAIRASAMAASVAFGVNFAGGVSLSGAGAEATNTILSKVHASIEGGHIVSGDGLDVNATNTNRITARVASLSVAASVGMAGFAVAIGNSVARNLIGWTAGGDQPFAEVQAWIEDAVIDVAGDLKLIAIATESIEADVDSIAAAVAAGSTGFAASGAGADVVNKVSSKVNAFITSADEGTGVRVTGNITMTARDGSTLSADALAASVAASFAPTSGTAITVGISLASHLIDNRIESYIEGSSVTTGNGTLAMTAIESVGATATAQAASVSVSTVAAISGGGANATVAITTTTKAFVDDSSMTLGGGMVVGAQDISVGQAEVKTTSVAAGILGFAAAGSTASTDMRPTVTGSVSDSVVSATGSVAITADSKARGRSFTKGNAFGTAFAASGSHATSDLSPTVEAFVGGGSVTSTGGTISLMSLFNANADGSSAATAEFPLGASSTAESSSGSILLGGGGGNATATTGGTISTYASGVLSAMGAISLTALSHSAPDAVARGITIGGLAAIGVSLATATSNTATSTSLTGAVTSASDLVIDAYSYQGPSSESTANSGGIVAGNGATATSTVLADPLSAPASKVSLGNVVLNVSGDIQMLAQYTPAASAIATGGAYGGVGVGASIATATAAGDVIATIASGADITAGRLSIAAVRNLPASNEANAVRARSSASAGALIGIAASEATARAMGDVTASTGNNIRLPLGDVAVRAISESRQHATASGYGIGLLAAGSNDSESTSAIDVNSTLGGNSRTAMTREGALSVIASGIDTNIAKTTGGGGGVIAGNSAHATTKDLSTVSTTILGNAIELHAGTVLVDAAHQSHYLAASDSTFGAVVGGSGAEADVTSSAVAATTLRSGVRLKAKGGITITSSADKYRVIDDASTVRAAGGAA